MMESKRIRDALSDINPDAVLFDNLDEALIGVGCIAHLEPVAIYSKKLIFDKLLGDGFSKVEVIEYFLNKIVVVFAGQNTPVILDDLYDCDEEWIGG